MPKDNTVTTSSVMIEIWTRVLSAPNLIISTTTVAFPKDGHYKQESTAREEITCVSMTILAMAVWLTLVLSRQSTQFTRNTPLCSQIVSSLLSLGHRIKIKISKIITCLYHIMKYSKPSILGISFYTHITSLELLVKLWTFISVFSFISTNKNKSMMTKIAYTCISYCTYTVKCLL